MSERRKAVNHYSFLDSDIFARSAREAGGPSMKDLNDLRFGTGKNAELLRAIYGQSEADFGDAAEYEWRQRQQQRPGAFIRKIGR